MTTENETESSCRDLEEDKAEFRLETKTLDRFSVQLARVPRPPPGSPDGQLTRPGHRGAQGRCSGRRRRRSALVRPPGQAGALRARARGLRPLVGLSSPPAPRPRLRDSGIRGVQGPAPPNSPGCPARWPGGFPAKLSELSGRSPRSPPDALLPPAWAQPVSARAPLGFRGTPHSSRRRGWATAGVPGHGVGTSSAGEGRVS